MLDSQWSLETVTPDQAAHYLENRAINRRLKPIQIKKIADDIRCGRWQVTHQGIAFNSQGKLVDGQNRLSAIVEAGKPVEIWVFRNLSPKGLLKTDITVARSTCDALQISGIDVSRSDIGTLRRMLSSMEQEPVAIRFAATEVVKQWWKKHGDAVVFASSCFSSRISGSSVMAVIARAFYTVDHNELREFVSVFLRGVGTKEHHVCAIALRDEFLRNRDGSGSQYGRLVMYRKSEKALSQFVKREHPLKIKEATTELFPIPA